jgi:hypothetical protein
LTDELRRRYSALRTAWLGAESAEANDAVEALAASIDTLAMKLRAAAREHAVARRRQAVLAGVASSDTGDGERDFAALSSLPGVASIEIAGEVLTITTGTIRVPHEGRSVELGRYAIEIGPRTKVLIKRVGDEARRGWEHPHIQAARPCLGNLQVGIETLLGRMELAPAVALLLQFLESYDAETAYCPIETWEEPVPVSQATPG